VNSHELKQNCTNAKCAHLNNNIHRLNDWTSNHHNCTCLVLCMSMASNYIILYLAISIDLLCQSIGTSSTLGVLLTKTHWELGNMYLWIRSAISKVLAGKFTHISAMTTTVSTTQSTVPFQQPWGFWNGFNEISDWVGVLWGWTHFNAMMLLNLFTLQMLMRLQPTDVQCEMAIMQRH